MADERQTELQPNDENGGPDIERRMT
jgi:hypothetical protein